MIKKGRLNMHTRSNSLGNMNQFKPFQDERDNLGRLLDYKDVLNKRPTYNHFSRINLARVLKEASRDKVPNYEKTVSPTNKIVNN